MLSVENQTDKLTGNFLRVENRGNSNDIDTVVHPVGAFKIKFNPSSDTTCSSTNINSSAQMT